MNKRHPANHYIENMNSQKIPFFGARKYARGLLDVISDLESEKSKDKSEILELKVKCHKLESSLAELGALGVIELETKRAILIKELNKLKEDQAAIIRTAEQDLEEIRKKLSAQQAAAESAHNQKLKELFDAEASTTASLESIRQQIIETSDLAMLQEVGIYQYRHPLTDAVAYQTELSRIGEQVKSMVKRDGGAVFGSTTWTVNGSAAQGRKMVNDTSKLMLRAFNAEADNLVRGMKPYKLRAAIDRLEKISETIAKLGKTMNIRITDHYLRIRTMELELTADFLQKKAEEKEIERAERERLREERKAQQEIERERARLEKERKHYENALATLIQKGDEDAAKRIREQIDEVQRAIEDVDYRAANIRAGYVYVISNLGSFGNDIVKIGMTRRLDPMDRVRELGDASVPFNFDVHALFFSKDAVGIESSMHKHFAEKRINQINLRREFFRITPKEAKSHLSELAGELLQFEEIPEALEYRESISRKRNNHILKQDKIADLPPNKN